MQGYYRIRKRETIIGFLGKIFMTAISDPRRKELYDTMRKSHPKGNPEVQLNFCIDISEERIEVYMKCFKSKI
jgi:hypothetical protein